MKRKGIDNREYQHRISAAILKAVLFSRARWCSWMAKITRRLSVRGQKVVFGGIGAALFIYYSWTILVPFSGDTKVIPDAGNVVKVETKTGPADMGNSGKWEEVDSAVAAFRKYRDSIKSVGGDPWNRFREQYNLK
jgi:hypothetical protein